MSFSGIAIFEKNLRTMMDSEAFKNSNDADKLKLGRTLLNSKFGKGTFFGFGEVEQLPDKGSNGKS